MAANPNKVPQRQWRKWNTVGRVTFNEMFDRMKCAGTVPLAPGLENLTKRAVKVLAWNTAWIAADEATAASK